MLKCACATEGRFSKDNVKSKKKTESARKGLNATSDVTILTLNSYPSIEVKLSTVK